MCSRSAKATFSNTDMSVNSAPNWNSMPILRRSAYRPSRVCCADVLALKQDLAALRAHQAADQAQHRGLAATRAAHDRDDLAALEAQVQVRQDEPVAVTEVDVAQLE